MNWQKDLRVKIKPLAPLKYKTSFKVGGKARYFCEPRNIAELQRVVLAARAHRIPVYMLGAGSNLLIADKGVEALVIKLNAPYFKKILFQKNKVFVGSGAMLGELLRHTAKRGLTGMEFLAGIPATVGGALVMNSGAWGRQIDKIVEEVQVMDYNGTLKTLKKKEISFSYRKSSLAQYIVLGARLRLGKKNARVVAAAIAELLKKKISTQEYAFPSAGCIFKNPRGKSAGKLIDACGLKGARIGGAYVSQKHANFIINKGRATATEVVRLMRLVRKKVKDSFDVDLLPEITIWK